MKIIKAGTYTFSPIPYIPAHMPSISQENFVHTVNTTYGELTGDYISFAPDETEELTEYWPSIQYGDELCFDHFGWPDEDYGPDCRTITTPSDQEVSDEFYDIFVKCTNYNSVNNIPIDAFGWRRLKTDYKPFPVWSVIERDSEMGAQDYVISSLKVTFKEHYDYSSSATIPIDAYITETSHAEGLYAEASTGTMVGVGFFNTNTTLQYASMIENVCTTSLKITSTANDTVSHWLAENTIPVTRKLTRLFPGLVVAKSATRQLRKLTTKKPQEESIVGTWRFNDTITTIPSASIATKVNFTSSFYVTADGKTYTEFDEMRINYLGGLSYNPTGVDTNYLIYGSNGWYDENGKTVNFGSTPQLVSKEFYDWFTANATRAEEESIIGTWVFNDYITRPDISYDVYEMPTEFNFYFIDDLGNQIDCDRITVYKKSLSPFFGVSVHKPETYYVTTIYSMMEDWVEEYYKTIYIVENTSSELFITWLKANATKIA